jgi:MscS family membrane protein
MPEQIVLFETAIEMTLVYKVIFTLVSLLVIIVISKLIINQAKRIQKQKKMKRSRYFLLRKVVRLLATMILAVILILIWGIDMDNLWGTLTSLIALLGIGFLAVWSLLGNILAGIIVFFTTPFKIGDHIEVVPDEVKGKVLAINTFYTLLLG